MSVYFLQTAGDRRIKIGYSADFEKRRKQIGKMASSPLTVLAVMPGTRQLKRELHARFAKHRVHGEWFKPHKSILDYLEFAKMYAAKESPDPDQGDDPALQWLRSINLRDPELIARHKKTLLLNGWLGDAMRDIENAGPETGGVPRPFRVKHLLALCHVAGIPSEGDIAGGWRRHPRGGRLMPKAQMTMRGNRKRKAVEQQAQSQALSAWKTTKGLVGLSWGSYENGGASLVLSIAPELARAFHNQLGRVLEGMKA